MDDRADTEDVFRARLPATPASIGIFRERLRRWLEQVHVCAAQRLDIVVACSESLTLVIDEQPRRVALVVDVEAKLEDGDLVLTTRDYGLCHETDAREPEEPLGVSLMRALMDSVELERLGDGRRITLRKRVSITNCEPRALPM